MVQTFATVDLDIKVQDTKIAVTDGDRVLPL